MFYLIEETVTPINIEEITEDHLVAGIISLEELEECYEYFGFSPATINECKLDARNIHSTIDVYDNYHFGIIVGIDSKYLIKVQDRIGIYIKKHLFLVVIIEDRDDSVHLKFDETLSHLNLAKISLERLIYAFLERMINDDYIVLEKIETLLTEHEERINEGHLHKNFNHEITKIRKKLLSLDNYYEQLILIGEELEENDIDLFQENNLRYFRMFTDRVTRLSNNTRLLQEHSIHVRESYHAQLDYNANNIMKLFTVVTTVFLPLSLIAGWYGMNFNSMPEVTWKYGYLYVILLSIVIAIICILFFKKKKFF